MIMSYNIYAKFNLAILGKESVKLLKENMNIT